MNQTMKLNLEKKNPTLDGHDVVMYTTYPQAMPLDTFIT